MTQPLRDWEQEKGRDALDGNRWTHLRHNGGERVRDTEALWLLAENVGRVADALERLAASATIEPPPEG